VPVRDWPEGAVPGREAAWDFNMRIRDSFEGARQRSSAFMPGPTKSWGHPRYDLRGAGSGAEVEHDYWFVATVRQGKILREQWFPDNADAIEAAGLRQ
jgi:ketosteroid isomerase-like protein